MSGDPVPALRPSPWSEWRPALAAAVVAVAAATAPPVPVALAAVPAVAGLVTRRVWLLVVAAAVVAGGRADAAWAAQAVSPPDRWDGVVTLGGDPQPVGPGLRVEVVADGRRYEAWAYGGAAGPLRRMLTGERVELAGRLEPLPPDRPDLGRRHLAGRLTVEASGTRLPAAAVHRFANGLRRTLAGGLSHLPADRQALITGVVYGDDRAQTEADRDAFRAAGLSHLLAVSGQNVAFVLAVAAPVLGRLSFRRRLPATLAVLALFGLVTRFEPSVLRATAMAGVAAWAAAGGRAAGGVRVLSLATIGVLLVDPLLVGSVGFQLSVLASGGILLFAAPVAARLPGPAWFREAAAVTLAAQLAVAPRLVAFGSVPVVSLPANLLAVPAAGPMMTWGLTGGLVAGVVGGPVAAVLHAPTDLLARWLRFVAASAASVPLGGLGPLHVALVWVGAAVAGRRGPASAPGRAALAGVALVVVHAALFGARPR